MSESVPEYVRTFVLGLRQVVAEKNASALYQLYETTWNKLSDKFFKQSEWPRAELIAPIVDNGPPRSPAPPHPQRAPLSSPLVLPSSPSDFGPSRLQADF